ncbi:MAG: Gfo/Idh/MocA family oxidoreductase [Ruminococcaceae bacterium]|nr:Gfo/Idh/MocA family oxidoreductase [Oscillospiraceae bacterium]
MDQVRYGIVGLGNMGSSHLKNFFAGKVPNGVVTAVCDLKQDRLDWAKAEVCKDADVAYFTDYKDLLACGKVDVVVIATPHYFHPIIGIDAFKAGLNVISEKPIGVYTKKVEEFIKAARESGKVFGLMFNQRTNPAYQKIREIVQSGELGELKRCVWIITDWYRTQAYYNSGGWRATWAGEGGGVLLNQCPHQLDLWQWIFGMPTRIRAFCHFGKYHDIEVEDDVTAYAEYANGATGVFVTTTGECPGTNRLEISGSKGKIVFENNVLKYTKLDVDEREWCFSTTEGFKKVSSTVEETKFEGSGEQHVGIFKNFTNHLLNGEPLLAPGYEGINGLSISNAMMLSTWKNDVVDLPNDGEEFWSYLQEKIKTSKVKEDVPAVVFDTEGTYGNK